MSKRLQVLLDPDEWTQLQEIARRHRTTVSEWVRRALREAREREPRGDLDTKLRTIRAAARHEFPTADIDQMLEEIERVHEVTRNGEPVAELRPIRAGRRTFVGSDEIASQAVSGVRIDQRQFRADRDRLIDPGL